MTAIATASARQLTKLLAGERHRGNFSTRCIYCARRCYGRTCEPHRDLIQIERELCSPTDQGA